jgi:aminoglycoside phosphotransferase (APT) family kinase protein
VIQPSKIQAYLHEVLGPDAELVGVKALGEEEHATGISNLLRLEVRVGAEKKLLILRRPASTVYSTEQPSDRASAVIQAYATYNRIPRHPRSLDVAVIHADGSLGRVPGSCEFVLLQEYVDGELYFPSLMQSLERNEVSELEERRAVALAEYLAELHSQRNDDIRIYRRALRDLVAGGVGVMGVLGGYSKELRDAHHDRLSGILKDFIALAWDLDRYPNRLCRIHGDFHPLNILFGKETQFSVIDAYGPGWGDAAFDVGTMLMNYYALHNEKGGLGTPAGRQLAERFLSAYVDRCDDPEGLYRVLPLPLARGALIMATTYFFPHRPEVERDRLIRLAGDILSARVFTPSLFTPRE